MFHPTSNISSALHLLNYKVLSSPTGTDTKSLWVRRGPIYKGWKSGHCLSCLLICLNFGFHEYSCLRFWNLLFVNKFLHIKSNSVVVCRGKKKALNSMTSADFDYGGCSNMQSCQCEPTAPETEKQGFCMTFCAPSPFCFLPLTGYL